MMLYFQVDPPHRWALLDRKNQLTDAGVVDSLEELPATKKITRLIGVVSGDAVVTRGVSVPARSRAKAMAAIPYALEDSLATDVEDLVFAMLDWQPGSESKVAVIEKVQMNAWVDVIKSLPRPVDALIPDYLLLPIHPQAQYTVARTKEQTICLRGRGLEGACLDENAIDLWWQEIDNPEAFVAINDVELARRLVKLGGGFINEWDIGSGFTEWLRYGAPPAQLNLLQGHYTPAHQQTGVGYKIAAGVFLAALLIKVAVDGYEYFSLTTKEQQLNTEIAKVFRETFPKAKYQNIPKDKLRFQFEQKIKSLRSGSAGIGEFQILLSAVARAVKATNARLEEISYRNNVLTITCTTKDFAALDRLKQQFEKDKRIQVKLESSGSRENRTSGRFKLERA